MVMRILIILLMTWCNNGRCDTLANYKWKCHQLNDNRFQLQCEIEVCRSDKWRPSSDGLRMHMHTLSQSNIRVYYINPGWSPNRRCSTCLGIVLGSAKSRCPLQLTLSFGGL